MTLTTIIFDVGGTLEEVDSTPETLRQCGEKILAFLEQHEIHLGVDADFFMETALSRLDEYRVQHCESHRELMPYEIWSQYYLRDFDVNQDVLRVISNDLTHIWEVSYLCRKLRPGASELLKSLKEKGYKLGVISNTLSLTQVYFSLEEYGVRKYFDYICLSSLSGFRKPHKALFTATARNLLSEPEQCVYVGDTVTDDVIGARNAGYGKTIRINSYLTGVTDLDPANTEEADHLIGSLPEISAILDAHNHCDCVK